MSEETPVKAHLRVSEVSAIDDAAGVHYTFSFNSNDGNREDFEGAVVYIDRDRNVEIKQGQILTLVFAEDVDFTPPETLPEKTSTRKS